MDQSLLSNGGGGGGGVAINKAPALRTVDESSSARNKHKKKKKKKKAAADSSPNKRKKRTGFALAREKIFDDDDDDDLSSDTDSDEHDASGSGSSSSDSSDSDESRMSGVVTSPYHDAADGDTKPNSSNTTPLLITVRPRDDDDDDDDGGKLDRPGGEPVMVETPVGEIAPGDTTPQLSRWRIIMLCLPVIAVQTGWCVGETLLTPYLISIGVSETVANMVYLANPLFGIFLHPFVGSATDKSKSAYGRRRPFLVAFHLAGIFGLIFITYSEQIIASLSGHAIDHSAATAPPPVLIGMIFFGFAVMDIGNDLLTIPTRARLNDQLPNSQKESGNAYFATIDVLGSCIGLGLTVLPLNDWYPFSTFGGGSHLGSTFVAASMLVAVSTVIAAVMHDPPRNPKSLTDEFDSSSSDESASDDDEPTAKLKPKRIAAPAAAGAIATPPIGGGGAKKSVDPDTESVTSSTAESLMTSTGAGGTRTDAVTAMEDAFDARDEARARRQHAASLRAVERAVEREVLQEKVRTMNVSPTPFHPAFRAAIVPHPHSPTAAAAGGAAGTRPARASSRATGGHARTSSRGDQLLPPALAAAAAAAAATSTTASSNTAVVASAAPTTASVNTTSGGATIAALPTADAAATSGDNMQVIVSPPSQDAVIPVSDAAALDEYDDDADDDLYADIADAEPEEEEESVLEMLLLLFRLPKGLISLWVTQFCWWFAFLSFMYWWTTWFAVEVMHAEIGLGGRFEYGVRLGTVALLVQSVVGFFASQGLTYVNDTFGVSHVYHVSAALFAVGCMLMWWFRTVLAAFIFMVNSGLIMPVMSSNPYIIIECYGSINTAGGAGAGDKSKQSGAASIAASGDASRVTNVAPQSALESESSPPHSAIVADSTSPPTAAASHSTNGQESIHMRSAVIGGRASRSPSTSRNRLTAATDESDDSAAVPAVVAPLPVNTSHMDQKHSNNTTAAASEDGNTTADNAPTIAALPPQLLAPLHATVTSAALVVPPPELLASTASTRRTNKPKLTPATSGDGKAATDPSAPLDMEKLRGALTGLMNLCMVFAAILVSSTSGAIIEAAGDITIVFLLSGSISLAFNLCVWVFGLETENAKVAPPKGSERAIRIAAMLSNQSRFLNSAFSRGVGGANSGIGAGVLARRVAVANASGAGRYSPKTGRYSPKRGGSAGGGGGGGVRISNPLSGPSGSHSGSSPVAAAAGAAPSAQYLAKVTTPRNGK